VDKYDHERAQWRAEAELVELGEHLASRNEVILHAYRAGVAKHRIHLLTGLSRGTVDTILRGEPPE
jgi:hypothetical protein